MFRLTTLAIAAFTLVGCSHTVQTTSGAQYLSDYDAVAPQIARGIGPTITPATESQIAVSENELIRRAAAVEPILRFPARFGLARIEAGRLTPIPETEAALWNEFATRYHAYGSFTPVDPIIAEFTSASLPPSNGAMKKRRDVPTKIRLGSARQHLDAVLIYEVAVASRTRNTGLAFVDLTILGGAILPTRDLQAAGIAKALLLDVRNGYPYGTASTEVDLSALSTSWGSDAREDRLQQKASAQVVSDLIPEVDAMFRDLVGRLAAKR